MNDLLLDYWITKLDLEHFIGALCVNLSWSLVSFVLNWMGHFFFCQFIDHHKLPGTIQDINKEPLMLSDAEL